jgi:hypothetical protein
MGKCRHEFIFSVAQAANPESRSKTHSSLTPLFHNVKKGGWVGKKAKQNRDQ